MICINCGKDNLEDAVFCRHCGVKMAHNSEKPAETSSNSGSENSDIKIRYTLDDCLRGGTSEIESVSTEDTLIHKPMGMKWYSFIVHIQLWLFMISLLVNGARFMFGLQYVDKRDAVYGAFPAVKYVDFLYGVAFLVLIVFAFITRKLLAQYREKGPRWYLTICAVVNVLFPVLYIIAASTASRVSVSAWINVETIMNLAFGVVYFVLNYVYFRKRRGLFEPYKA